MSRAREDGSSRGEGIRVILEELTLGLEGESDKKGGKDVMYVLHILEHTNSMSAQAREKRGGGKREVVWLRDGLTFEKSLPDEV